VTDPTKDPGFLPAIEGVHGEYRMVPIESIEPNPWNINQMTPDEFGALKEGIKLTGHVQRARVRSGNPNNEYKQTWELIDGYHNWTAAKELGWPNFPIELLELDDAMARKASVMWNQHGHATDASTADLLASIEVDFGDKLREGLAISQQHLDQMLEAAKATPSFPGPGGDDKPPADDEDWVEVKFKAPQSAVDVIERAKKAALTEGEKDFLAFERMASEFLAQTELGRGA